MQTLLPSKTILNCRGRLLSLDKPLIVSVLNLTPDSFSDGGRYNTPEAAVARVRQMLAEGADLVDVGGASSRPGAAEVGVDEEVGRLLETTGRLLETFPDLIISIDTYRAEVAKTMLELGVHIINDISAGSLDLDMLPTVARYDCPYILMHTRGTPANMQQLVDYADVTEEVWQYFVDKINLAKSHGVHDLILDPGFGFAKTFAHNLELMRRLDRFRLLGLPLMVGVSRKAMMRRLAGDDEAEMLPLTSAIHLRALFAGATFLRVHDVRSAALARDLYLRMCDGAV